jgi:restriction endonuclease S subunit
LFPHGVLFRQEEADMRRKLIEADAIECVLGLGPNLFYNSPMEACVVICRTTKPKARKNKILLINAINEVTRERAQSFLTDDHIEHIVSAYEKFADEPGFARVVTLEEVRAKDGNLSLPLYIASAATGNNHEVKAKADLVGSMDQWRQSSAAVGQSLAELLPKMAVPNRKNKTNQAWAKLPLFNRKNWSRLRFGDIVENVNERVEPSTAAEAIYVGLDDLDSGSLHIRRWGKGSDVIGTKLGFRKGDVIFGRRRAYQRKLAVAEVDGICSAHAMVARAKPKVILPEFLPFLMMSDKFMNRAVDISVGSLSPTINWTTLKLEEFDLPPLDQQRRIAEILWAVDEVVCEWRNLQEATNTYAQNVADEVFRKQESEHHELATVACETITVGIVVRPASYYTDAKTGVPTLRSLNVFPNRYDLSELVYLSQAGNDKHKKSQLRKGDVIVVRTGRPGDAAVVTEAIAGMNLIDLILVRPKPHLLPEYLVSFLNSAFGRQKITRGSAGTAQQHFNVGEFERLQLPVPKLKEQTKAIEQFQELEQSSAACKAHAAAVVALQKSLLEEMLK